MSDDRGVPDTGTSRSPFVIAARQKVASPPPPKALVAVVVAFLVLLALLTVHAVLVVVGDLRGDTLRYTCQSTDAVRDDGGRLSFEVTCR